MHPILADFLDRCPLIAILRGVQPSEVVDVGNVLVDAGFSIIEIPLNSPDPLISVESLVKRFGEQMLIGAGTVLTPEDVLRVEAAGARLVVSPNTSTAVIRAAKERGLVSIPGVCTPTEAFLAIATGADAVKLFPAEVLVPRVVRAMTSVLPGEVPLLAVGGISATNMEDYLRAGVSGFGIGSSLYRPGKSLADVARDASAIGDAYRTARDLLAR